MSPAGGRARPHLEITMNAFERTLLALESPPWGACYRIVIGYWVVPTLARFSGIRDDARIFPLFLAVLVALRLAPLIFRRLLPISPELKERWAKRRMLAKRFDSYQWRKLFWIGIGLAGSVMQTRDLASLRGLLALLCLLAGAAGLGLWKQTGVKEEALA